MLYDLLAFFGPFVVAGLTRNSSLARQMRTSWWVPVAFAATLGYEVLAFKLPFRSLWAEFACAIAGTLTIALIFTVFPFEGQRDGPRWLRAASVLLLIPLLPIISFTLVGRVNQAQKIAVQCDGIVSQTYRSRGIPSLVVTQADGSTVTMDNVDRATWEHVVPGRSHLKKPAWSVDGELDQRPVRIVR